MEKNRKLPNENSKQHKRKIVACGIKKQTKVYNEKNRRLANKR